MRVRFVLAWIVLATAGLAGGSDASAATSGDLTWHAPKLHSTVHGGLVSISCPSATYCRAGDANGLVKR